MGQLTKTNFEAITDSLGEQYALLVAVKESTEIDDLTTGATGNLNRVDALSDKRAQADLLASFLDVTDAITNGTYLAPRLVYTNALARLQRNVGNFTTYMQAQSAKVSRNFASLCAACGITINPSYIFEAADVTVATVTVTAANTGTFGAASALDPAVTGPVRMVAKVTSNVTVGFTLNCTMKKANAQTEVKAVVIPASSTVGAEVNVGSGTDVYVDCTAIAVVGGGSADGAVGIVAEPLRTPAI